MTKKSSQDMKFIIYTTPLDFKIGGVVVLHKLAKDLIDLGHKAMLYISRGDAYENIFCNEFATMKDVDDSTIVIYPEVIVGNPLNAKCVVRWMLCDMGIHCSKEIGKTWGAEDLIFHFSSFNERHDLNAIEILYTFWIDPCIKNKKLSRSGSCYLYKKASAFHKNIKLIHPMDAIMVDQCSMEEIIEIFNQKEFFYCYDPYSFYDIIALLCGCIPIIYPITDVSKLDWLKTRASFQMHLKRQDNISGVAYGEDDIPYAKATLAYAEKEQSSSLEFEKKSIVNFVDKTDSYFFKDKESYPFKTVEKALKALEWNQSLSLDESLDHIQLQEQKIKDLQSFVKQQQQEINFMRSSKFWKLRQLIKSVVLK